MQGSGQPSLGNWKPNLQPHMHTETFPVSPPTERSTIWVLGVPGAFESQGLIFSPQSGTAG